MKRLASIFIFSLAITLVFLSTNQAFAANLFIDPGFENGVNNWATIGYPFSATNSVAYKGTYPFNYTNTVRHSGTFSAYGQIANSSGQYGFIFQEVPYHTYVADGIIVHNRKPVPTVLPE